VKQGLTEIICILDMTGSMAGQVADTIGGFNQFIKDQLELPGECKVTVVFFNASEYTVWQDAVDAKDVPELTGLIYRPQNNTPLIDAMAKTIVNVGKRLEETPEDERPERVLVMTMTDGQENWSKEFTKERLIEMIRTQREEFSWEFVFLGADLDSFGQGQQYGIANAVNYDGSTKQGYQIMRCAAARMRTSGKVGDLTDISDEEAKDK
jgi:hypothetical protein